MKLDFKKFATNIRLTDAQKEDAKTKYTGVCECLYKKYYDGAYDGNSKFLFGSYKTRTNTRPLSESQDVDVLFKIPEETYKKFKDYESNGPSALLQEVREALKEKYTTTETIKAWGKVVLVKMSENHHNVEVLPAYEQEDGTFLIPNSDDGGIWESFDPRAQVDEFTGSNADTNYLTADLTRMMKTWVKTTASMNYESYSLLNNVMSFLRQSSVYNEGAEYSDYHLVVRDFFDYLDRICTYSLKSHVSTALSRAKKAVDYLDQNKPKEASDELRKIFGNEFPKVHSNPASESNARTFFNPSKPYGNSKLDW